MLTCPGMTWCWCGVRVGGCRQPASVSPACVISHITSLCSLPAGRGQRLRSVCSGPKGAGRLVRSARAELTAPPQELWAGRARSLRAGAGGAGPLRPGRLLRLQTASGLGSSTRHASHRIGCLFFAACFCSKWTLTAPAPLVIDPWLWA